MEFFTQNPNLLRVDDFVPAGVFDQELKKSVRVSNEPLPPVVEQDLKRQSCRTSNYELR
jgi:hypothetical protein